MRLGDSAKGARPMLDDSCGFASPTVYVKIQVTIWIAHYGHCCVNPTLAFVAASVANVSGTKDTCRGCLVPRAVITNNVVPSGSCIAAAARWGERGVENVEPSSE